MWPNGQTRDISAEGAYRRASENNPLGRHVEVYFKLLEKSTARRKGF